MAKTRNSLILGAALLVGAMVALPVLAHGGGRYYGGYRSSFSVVVGVPAYSYWYPGPYYYPYYYPYRPAVVAVPSAPTTYIERGDAYTPAEQQQGYWYYCEAAKAYYPYVKQCAGGWQRVSPQPPPQ